MGLGQSPPTTSGVVVLSGSNNFGPGSDFPAFASLDIKFDEVEDQIWDPPTPLAVGTITGAALPTMSITSFDEIELPLPVFDLAPAVFRAVPVMEVDFSVEDDRVFTYLPFVPIGEGSKITSTPVTTSGIVILEFYPGVGVTDGGIPPYVPPVYLNQRIYPVTFSGLGERLFPEENRRIYPVLPQFSTLTPGG